jgi:hypothetical protein
MQPEQQQETNIWQGLLPPVQPATLDTTKHSLPSSTHIDATQRRLQVTIGSIRARRARMMSGDWLARNQLLMNPLEGHAIPMPVTILLVSLASPK